MSVKVRLNTNTTGIIMPSTTVVIKNSAATLSVGRLDALQDVVEGTSPQSGDTLVYNQLTDKYEVRKLDFGDLVDELDGGTF